MSQKQSKKLLPLYARLEPLQQEAVDRALDVKTFALLAEQRTGKTWISLAVIEALLPAPEFVGLIISLKTNKESTWLASLTRDLPHLLVCDTWATFAAARKAKKSCVLLTHYDQLTSMIKKLRKVKWTLIIVDESQRLKDRGNVSSRRLKQLRNSAEYKIILSGTPVEKQPQDLWGQFRFLNPDVLGDVWGPFEGRFLVRTGFMGHKREFIPARFEEFMELIKPWSRRIDAADLGILPPTIIDYPIHLTGRAREIYDQFEQHAIVTVDGAKIRGKLVITQAGRLHQMCGGSIIDEEGNIHVISGAKTRAISRLVSREAGPVVIFCRYVNEMIRIERVLARRGYSIGMLYGKIKDTTKEKRRTNLLASFQRRELDVLVCQIRTGGVGVDLYAAAFAIVASTTYSLIDLDQAFMRLCHINRKDAPKVYVLRAVDTIEDEMYDGIDTKRDTSKAIYARLLTRRRQ